MAVIPVVCDFNVFNLSRLSLLSLVVSTQKKSTERGWGMVCGGKDGGGERGEWRRGTQRRLAASRFSLIMVSNTTLNTTRMLDVSVAVVKWG